MNVRELSRGAIQLGWTSCLTSAGRITLAGGTTFFHINNLARQTGITVGVAECHEMPRLLKSLNLYQRSGINFAKPTAIE